MREGGLFERHKDECLERKKIEAIVNPETGFLPTMKPTSRGREQRPVDPDAGERGTWNLVLEVHSVLVASSGVIARFSRGVNGNG